MDANSKKTLSDEHNFPGEWIFRALLYLPHLLVSQFPVQNGHSVARS